MMMDGPALQDGETALWSGRPEGGIAFRPFDWLLVPFGIVWAGIAIAAFRTNLSAGVPFVWLAGLLLGGSALYLTIGRFVVDLLRRQGTRYYLTDRRAVIETRFPVRRTRVKTITDTTSVEYGEGRTLDVWFGTRPGPFRGGRIRGAGMMGLGPPGFVFERIADGDALRRHLDAPTRTKR